MEKTYNKSVFETLSSINCNEHTEKKNGLTYLSWAWAWGIAKKCYPGATFRIYENADGLNYHHDGRTCWVKTGVTIEGIEMIEYLPVMDYKNLSIPLAKVTSTDVNKTIQRSLTKALARHGLGLYIYAGEDIPDASDDDNRDTVNQEISEYLPKEIKDELDAAIRKDLGFDQELEVAIADLKAAKSRKQVHDVDMRYRNIYGTYASQANARYMDTLKAMCEKYPSTKK